MLRDAGNIDDIRAYRAAACPGPQLGADALPAGGGRRVRRAALEPARVHRPVPRRSAAWAAASGCTSCFSTQRLEEGKLRGLESHLRYRICLRTYSAVESKVVLGTPDAYLLPPLPGRRLPEGRHLDLRALQGRSRVRRRPGAGTGRAERPGHRGRALRAGASAVTEARAAEPEQRRGSERARPDRRAHGGRPRGGGPSTRCGCRPCPLRSSPRSCRAARRGGSASAPSPRSAPRSVCSTCLPSSARTRSRSTSRARRDTSPSSARRRPGRAACSRRS